MLRRPNTRIRPAPPDNSALLVRTDDAINKPGDLAGKTDLCRPHQQRQSHPHGALAAEGKGVDPTSVRSSSRFPFPQMADALFQKRVDAVWNVEPFMTFMVKTGNARIVVHPYQENIRHGRHRLLSRRRAGSRATRDVALRFKRAMDKATRYLNARPQGGARRLGCEIHRRQDRAGCPDDACRTSSPSSTCRQPAQRTSTLRWRKRS